VASLHFSPHRQQVTDSITSLRLPFSLDPSQAPLLAAGVFVLLVIVWLLFRREAPFPYEPARALLTNGERAFARILREAVGNDFQICHKVRLADVIVVRSGTSAKHRMRCFNRICGKHLDFVLCHPETFEVLGIVELDDRSHREASRRERDAFIDEALTAAGLPILHMPAQRSYSARKLRSQILELLETGGAVVAERH
jgi:very-short-patch-repair endonuclease